MTHLLKAVPLMAALVAAPALAQTADQHVAHHPKAPVAAAAAKPDPKAADVTGCPRANGQVAGGQMMGGQSTGAHMADGHMANSQAMTDYMAKNQMMGGQGASPGTMMGGQGAGAMMGGAAGGPPGGGNMMAAGQGGPGVGGMMAGGQTVRCPNAAPTPTEPKK